MEIFEDTLSVNASYSGQWAFEYELQIGRFLLSVV